MAHLINTEELGNLLKKQKRRPLLVPADVYRPAAIEQLKTVGRQLGLEVFHSTTDQKPFDICVSAMKFAELNGYDTVILDTAGRHQIDDFLMNELNEINGAVQPREILFVADAMTGQHGHYLFHIMPSKPSVRPWP